LVLQTSGTSIFSYNYETLDIFSHAIFFIAQDIIDVDVGETFKFNGERIYSTIGRFACRGRFDARCIAATNYSFAPDVDFLTTLNIICRWNISGMALA
jgi:hypothetical protein